MKKNTRSAKKNKNFSTQSSHSRIKFSLIPQSDQTQNSHRKELQNCFQGASFRTHSCGQKTNHPTVGPNVTGKFSSANRPQNFRRHVVRGEKTGDAGNRSGHRRHFFVFDCESLSVGVRRICDRDPNVMRFHLNRLPSSQRSPIGCLLLVTQLPTIF